jgi:hypothetical protein
MVIKKALSFVGKSNVSKWQLLKMNPQFPTKQLTLFSTITLSEIPIDSFSQNNLDIANSPTYELVPRHRFDRIARQRREVTPMFSNNKPLGPSFDSILQYSKLSPVKEQNPAQAHSLALFSVKLLRSNAVCACFAELPDTTNPQPRQEPPTIPSVEHCNVIEPRTETQSAAP